MNLLKINWKKLIFLLLLFIFIFLGLRILIFTLTPFFIGFIIALIIDKPVNFIVQKDTPQPGCIDNDHPCNQCFIVADASS